MAFGLFEGKMILKLSSTNFKHGDTIKGSAVLKLNKPTKARGVKVKLWAEMSTTTPVVSNRGTTMQSGKRILYEFEKYLDNMEREYKDAERFEFELQVPQEQEMPKVEGVMGGLIAAAQTFQNMVAPTKWYILASLDIPMGIDIAKKQQLSIV